MDITMFLSVAAGFAIALILLLVHRASVRARSRWTYLRQSVDRMIAGRS